jgi:acyl-CoA synthetase (AMP-forming)/AMP-acid ligase II
MGLMGCILYPLISGAHSVQMSPYDMILRPLSWLEAVSNYKCTISGGPTFAFLECLNRIRPEECAHLDLRSWERAFCGAEPVPAGLLDRFRDRFAPNGLAPDAVFSCYGMAECTLFAAGEAGHAERQADLPEGWQVLDGCLLSPQTRANIRIADPETGAERTDGAPGEIFLSGGSICGGYLEQPDETEALFHIDADGRRWMRTGDLGGIAGHHLYITGRIKDIVLVNGRNVAAAEIEWLAAREHNCLNPSAAAAFVDDGSGRGHAHLCIEIRPGAEPPEDPEEVASQIRKSVAGSCGVMLDTVCIVPRGSLPRTSSGKIRRQLIAKNFAKDKAVLEPQDRAPAYEATS